VRAAILALTVLLAACGASPGTGNAAGPGARALDAPHPGSVSTNTLPVLMRVSAPEGARYRTRTVARTVAQGATILTEADGRLVILSRDAAGIVDVESRFDSMRLSDPDGAPVGSPAAYDLTGVVLRRRMDARGARVGDVIVQGTSAANAAFAETIRESLQQSVVRLPEQPVRVGDRWNDTSTMALPIQGSTMQCECRADYELAAIEHGTAGASTALLRFQVWCHGYMEIDVGDRVLPLTVDSATTGEHRVALADGISGVLTMQSETTSELDTHAEIIASRMQQWVETRTSPDLR